MGIRFECVHCGHTLHVKDYLAGKRGICPHCQGKIDIPFSSTDAASGDEPSGIAVELKTALEEQPTREMRPQDVANHQAASIPLGAPLQTSSADALGPRVPAAAGGDPIGEAPQLQWYVLPPGSMTKYGPAQGETMRAWLEEGRVAADALVWREGWPQWRGAAAVFPRLAQSAVPMATARPGATVSSNAAPVNTGPIKSGPMNATPANSMPVASAPIGSAPIASVPVSESFIADEPRAAPYSAAPGGEAVVLGDDDVQPVTKRAAARHKPARHMRDQRSMIIALLVVLVVILLPLLVWVLLHQ
ncbi:MAG TPA: GYF domain-containing protein [Pirellulales bacterium]|nr:GYF domain-containing protein [Pirellulales bacterium]